jgi:hypothetical protein
LLSSVLELAVEAVARQLNSSLHDTGEPHRGKDANRWRATHRERADRAAEFIQRRNVAFYETLGQLTLIDNSNGAAFRGPTY